MPGRRWRTVAVALCLLIAAGGCASAHEGAASSPATPAPFQPMRVTAVRLLDQTHVRITAEVPAPVATCVHDLAGHVTGADEQTVLVQLTFVSPAPAEGVCTGTASATTTVTVPAIRGRLVGVDSEAPWGPVAGSSTYRHCTGPFGCSPPPRNHCDPGWLRLAGHSGELQPERSYRTLGCDQHWLVMDIDATVTGCQPLDGASPPSGCRSTGVRWFFAFRPADGWTVVAAGGAAGCADVHRMVPAFPTSLCARLPAR